MRTFVTAMFVVVSTGLGTMAAAAAPKPADQARTMEEVIDRVTTRENEMNQNIRKYSPLVETYIQNLKPDKDLGYTPAGDKYFLGKADFGKGVNLVSLTDTDPKGKKIFMGIGNFFSFAMQYLPDGFLQMIFIDTNGFDKQHYKFDYVKREFLGEVRCLYLTSRRCRSPARGGSSGAFGWKIRTTTSCASTVDMGERASRPFISTSIAGVRTCSRACGCRRSCTAKRKNCITR
jgi:hypothetical protein